MIEAPPPQNREAEENVLGAMLISEKAIDICADILEPGDFFYPSHGIIFRAALEMHAIGKGVDVITLTDELEQSGLITDAGGRVRLHEIAALVPATANVKHWAEIVREKSMLRQIGQIGYDLWETAREGPSEPEKLLQQAESRLLAVADRRAERHERLFSAKEIVARYREKMANPELEERDGVPSPWAFLRPLQGGRLYVLAAYTGDGKTATATQFLRAGCEAGKRVDVASIEMSVDDMTARLVSTFGIPHFMAQSGQVDGQYVQAAESALNQIEAWDFHIIDDESIDVGDLRRHVRMRRPDLLIIDHLHRMEWKERRDLELAIRSLTNIAREYDIPILLLAQLKRSGDWKDPFPRPNLTMLRETSVLEQEAYAVWFIWRKRDEFYQPTTEAEFAIAKNRGGSLGYQRMEFVPSEVRFRPAGAVA